MKPLTFKEYFEYANDRFLSNPDERLGQAYFNTLSVHRPDLAEQIRGRGLDPFHMDSRLTEFLDHLSEVWDR